VASGPSRAHQRDALSTHAQRSATGSIHLIGDSVKRLRRAADTFGVLLFALLFCVFIVQVVARFGFNRPLGWTDELAVVLYIWVILWAAAFMVPQREHVKFDIIYQGASPRGRRLMRGAASVLIGGGAAWALPANWDYIRFMAREGTPVLGVPFMWVFLPFVLLLISLVVRCAWELYDVLRGRDAELKP
jgi:TRAP-type C4-dicarboxylate transport system permease small subunit